MILIGCGIAVAVGIVVVIIVLVVRNRGQFEFVWVNDIHVDPLYVPNSHWRLDPDGDCRRPYVGSNVLFRWGQYGCDPPLELYSSMAQALPKISKKPKFLFFGGDGIGHGLGYNRSQVRDLLNWSLVTLQNAYPGVPLLMVLGNNEFVPNYGTFENDAGDFESLAEVIDLTGEHRETFLKGGYYFYDFEPAKLRLLLLNSVIYTRTRRPEVADPYDQLAWAEAKAREAVGRGWRVAAAMHVQPGVCDIPDNATALSQLQRQGWWPAQVERFDEILHAVPFEFLLVGHSHMDLILPLFSADRRLEHYALSSIAISPQHGNNPGFRIGHIDRNGAFVDYEAYFADLLPNPKEVTWELEYSFKKIYKTSGVRREGVRSAVDWITNTSEGRWRYREHMPARADQDGAFWHCLLLASDPEAVQQCWVEHP